MGGGEEGLGGWGYWEELGGAQGGTWVAEIVEDWGDQQAKWGWDGGAGSGGGGKEHKKCL